MYNYTKNMNGREEYSVTAAGISQFNDLFLPKAVPSVSFADLLFSHLSFQLPIHSI